MSRNMERDKERDENNSKFYDNTAKSMFDNVQSAAALVLMQESKRIDRAVEIMTRELERMRSANNNIRKLIEEMNTDLSGRINNSHNENQVFSILKRTNYLYGELDSSKEMYKMSMTGLQMVMDAFYKSMEITSNVLKKFSQTQQSIIQNIK